MKAIFIGTPDFGIPALCALIDDKNFDVAGVVTQPDKKIGRKQVISCPACKLEAQKCKIPVWQPDSIKSFDFPVVDIDLIIVAAYAQIIPKKILEMPKYGCINIHGSLLPKYRGASCIQAAIINGDVETGVTIIKMNEGLDTGDILAQEKIKIEKNDTTGTLFGKISQLGGKLLIPTLKKYIQGEIKSVPQNNSRASYVGMLSKKDGHIDWTKSAIEIERFVRAMNPWPSAYAQIKNEKSKVKSQLVKIIGVDNNIIKINKYKPGELFLHNNELAIQCGTNSLNIKKIQLGGKKPLNSNVFLQGNSNLIGKVLN
ncbi:methionyl-tRNA formyltransferase [Candidatus Falkowbacteria bacterium RIFOXYB2_FULL_34_18]|uniref:Methionyl-tRNA formyltransferase n=1 Tax=Candidatus Falkowbacteria bacterium RIFOXYD2_FULL_34_120 TaxID=1798007 RepID=A0A1F5TQG8_9BACT|nr:MAG: methionyl-tRNA formyltransferase [Candidatus Falkowbacteria bacterium RIFOXYB2_FULL_34_18]OGF29410.1 MAG: methionyl-tRNA formyltransferase [Candidatus Falkowbacteria bacterium RIFOXYC12_FULL_34_55]OGF36619.1 MAG: methionyl-tRNA formyltransferase [Candidatus Falkowbacteria bacterium RIFOXYC2_FULL_34_220]OGF38837.1 MAG: methionyl-tRNA formyltransferase [Candidatus Falkowbacteria bacterium RIFOXYD12_FULL_34_57]OGF41089.1 MAG: methionyl-tRNA formyltransferase [Candidatus Falkowbacteria bact